MGTAEHKKDAPQKVTIAILTLSTTRTIKEDASGQWIKETAAGIGHEVVCHRVIPDDAATIKIQIGVKS